MTGPDSRAEVALLETLEALPLPALPPSRARGGARGADRETLASLLG